jgi:hypothetical protein
MKLFEIVFVYFFIFSGSWNYMDDRYKGEEL